MSHNAPPPNAGWTLYPKTMSQTLPLMERPAEISGAAQVRAG
jgi:hypothetical protein